MPPHGGFTYLNNLIMDYNFFLFTKLHEIIFNPKTEYDRLWKELILLYEDWEVWDLENGRNIGTYESILNFLDKVKELNA
jgi:hypothetical protein